MKKSISNLFLLPALIAGLGLIPAGRATAQTFTTLHSFTAYVGATNSDGGVPRTGLIASGNILYGVAQDGGLLGGGTVYAIATDGTGFTNLHSFPPAIASPTSDGSILRGTLVLSGNTLYGTAQAGGSGNRGTVFKVNTDGTGFTKLHDFTANPDGNAPRGGLILSGTTLYGTTTSGGSSSEGMVYAINTDGSGYTNLHSFTSASDGANPQAALILSGDTLYGAAQSGGGASQGTVFAVKTNGTGFTNLHSFISASDGRNPATALFLSGNSLYGTTQGGGSANSGTVFAIHTDGTGFTNLYNFTGVSLGTNSDGAYPLPGVILSGNTLYGTTAGGGSSANGTVFAIHTDGTGIIALHHFVGAPTDGSVSESRLLLSGNTLYGTTLGGGSAGNGTVFSLSLPSVSRPLLTITRAGANAILTWPTNFTGFTLEANTNLNTANWAVVTTNTPATSGANNVVTNSITGREKHYRLRGL